MSTLISTLSLSKLRQRTGYLSTLLFVCLATSAACQETHYETSDETNDETNDIIYDPEQLMEIYGKVPPLSFAKALSKTFKHYKTTSFRDGYSNFFIEDCPRSYKSPCKVTPRKETTLPIDDNFILSLLYGASEKRYHIKIFGIGKYGAYIEKNYDLPPLPNMFKLPSSFSRPFYVTYGKNDRQFYLHELPQLDDPYSREFGLLPFFKDIQFIDGETKLHIVVHRTVFRPTSLTQTLPGRISFDFTVRTYTGPHITYMQSFGPNYVTYGRYQSDYNSPPQYLVADKGNVDLFAENDIDKYKSNRYLRIQYLGGRWFETELPSLPADYIPEASFERSKDRGIGKNIIEYQFRFLHDFKKPDELPITGTWSTWKYLYKMFEIHEYHDDKKRWRVVARDHVKFYDHTLGSPVGSHEYSRLSGGQIVVTSAYRDYKTDSYACSIAIYDKKWSENLAVIDNCRLITHHGLNPRRIYAGDRLVIGWRPKEDGVALLWIGPDSAEPVEERVPGISGSTEKLLPIRTWQGLRWAGLSPEHGWQLSPPDPAALAAKQ